MLNIGWFSTGRDIAASELLQTVQKNIMSGEINGNIIFTFSNREPGEFIESDQFFDLVNAYYIPLVCYSSKRYFQEYKSNDTSKRRLEYDRVIMKKLKQYNPDICVLAGYMLIVGEEMCQKYDMINLHPAEPQGPKGTWQEVIWDLMENKSKTSGVMMHLVTPELDRGPVITYCTYDITGGPFTKYWGEISGKSIDEIKAQEGENNQLFQLVRKYGLAREFPLIVLTLKSLCNGDVKIINKKIFNKANQEILGYNLSAEIDKAIGAL